MHQNRVPSEKPNIVDKKKQVIDKIEKMDGNLEKLRSTFNYEKQEKPAPETKAQNGDDLERKSDHPSGKGEEDMQEGENNEELKQNEDQDIHDEIDSLYYGAYSESRRSEMSRRSDASRRSEVSRRSNVTSATYISKLEKELQEERRAREKLAKELEEIKKISSEISSHLGLKQAMENKNN